MQEHPQKSQFPLLLTRTLSSQRRCETPLETPPTPLPNAVGAGVPLPVPPSSAPTHGAGTLLAAAGRPRGGQTDGQTDKQTGRDRGRAAGAAGI